MNYRIHICGLALLCHLAGRQLGRAQPVFGWRGGKLTYLRKDKAIN
jgi:hypothetical protein